MESLLSKTRDIKEELGLINDNEEMSEIELDKVINNTFNLSDIPPDNIEYTLDDQRRNLSFYKLGRKKRDKVKSKAQKNARKLNRRK
jgi:hypothetical protein